LAFDQHIKSYHGGCRRTWRGLIPRRLLQGSGTEGPRRTGTSGPPSRLPGTQRRNGTPDPNRMIWNSRRPDQPCARSVRPAKCTAKKGQLKGGLPGCQSIHGAHVGQLNVCGPAVRRNVPLQHPRPGGGPGNPRPHASAATCPGAPHGPHAAYEGRQAGRSIRPVMARIHVRPGRFSQNRTPNRKCVFCCLFQPVPAGFPAKGSLTG